MPLREQPLRFADRLEATLRAPEGDWLGIVVIAHPLPTNGGTMLNPVVAVVARECAARGVAALRFNFRGVGASTGAWDRGIGELDDLHTAIEGARALAPDLPLGLAGYSFGALMAASYGSQRGHADALVLIAPPFRVSVPLAVSMPPHLPPALIICGELDEISPPADARATYPGAEIAVIAGADHFFRSSLQELAVRAAEYLHGH